MDREEAIQVLQTVLTAPFIYGKYAEALDMAIESLSNCTTKKPNDAVEQKNDVVAEPTDLISRADAIEAVEDGMCTFYDCDVFDRINAVPSADRPSGEWEDRGIYRIGYACSLCGGFSITESNYCPNCGAKMGSDTR